MIRAGWVLQYRLHGVPPADTGKGCNLESNAGEPGLRIQVEFQMKTPTFPAKILKGISTLRPGTSERPRFEGKPVPRPEEDGFHVPYTWLTIMVTDEFELGHDLEATVGIGDEKHGLKTRLLNEVIPRLDDPRDKAFFIAAVFASFFRTSLFELWIQQPILFYGERGVFTKIESTIAVVPSWNVRIDTLIRYLETMGQIAFSNKETAPLLIAGKWLIHARQQHSNETERFFTNYRVLETLAYSSAKEYSKKERKKINRNLDTLEELALERSGELAEFVKGVRNRIIDVPIAEKFAKLAQELFPVEAEKDIGNFKAIKDIRDALVHGTKGQVPREFRGKNVIQVVAELAHRYFLTASSRALGIKVQVKIPDNFLEPPLTISAHFGVILPSRSDE